MGLLKKKYYSLKKKKSTKFLYGYDVIENNFDVNIINSSSKNSKSNIEI
jgi:hypothetical protein